MAEVSIQRLSFAYGGSNKEVLKDISWEVNRGEFVCILGQSGCGKSTLLRLLAGLEVPTVGEILLEGEPVKGAGLNRGVVFQDYGLFPWMTAGKNITLALHQRFPKADKSDLKRERFKLSKMLG